MDSLGEYVVYLCAPFVVGGDAPISRALKINKCMLS
jgi:hypothetical protein